MELPISKIPYQRLTEAEQDEYHGLSDEPFGTMLAAKVAEKLKRNPSSLSKNGFYTTAGGLYHAHRDYCGIGLYFFEGKFTVGEVNDGMGPQPMLGIFDDEEQFVAWLSRQSDQSMALIFDGTYGSRFNNQTITKVRLQWYLEEQYSPVWNAYCAYVREKNQ